MLDAIQSVDQSPTIPMVVPFPLEQVDEAQRTIATALHGYLLTQERAYSGANYCALDHLVDASNRLGDAIDRLVETLPPGC
jgi:hypothetical protein